MQADIKSIEYCIDQEYSMNDFFQYLNDYTEKEHAIIVKCKTKDVRQDTGCSYYHIQRFCERKRMNLKSYFKLVKYARRLTAQLR